MALQKDLSKKAYGQTVSIPNAYIKVMEVKGGKTSIRAKVMSFASSDTQSPEIDTVFYRFTPDLNGENFIRQAYVFLKTLPEFADAEDV